MRDSLAVLERIKKFELDEQQRILVIELGQEEALQKKLNQLTEDYEKEKEFAMQNPLLCDFGAYTDKYLKEKKRLEKRLAAVREKIAEIRDIMADIFKEQKTYSIVDENRKKRKQKEEDIKEQKMLDEIGTNVYIKKHQE